jgi:LacI family transcriptional regulator
MVGDSLNANPEPATKSGGRANLRDVAQRAGVAVSTVSRVLSNHPDVSRRTHDRVMAVVDELGYQPNMLGQMLRQGATRTMGFAIGDISNPLLAQIALGAETTLGKHGYSLLLCNSMNDPDHELRNLRMLEQRRVDGLLLSVTTERDSNLLAILNRFDGPMVAIDREIRSKAAIGSVYSNHGTGIAVAVRALYDAGHRHILLITGLSELRPGRQRVEAAVETAESLGMRCTVKASSGPRGPGYDEIAPMLKQRHRATAIIAGNNQIIGGVLDALEKSGMSYPADVSLVACDEVPLLRFFRPRIATVRRDPYQLGHVSADILVERLMSAAHAVRHVELPTSFDAGESIGPPR